VSSASTRRSRRRAASNLGLAGEAADSIERRVVIRGDASGLRALLTNLVDNALRHTARGGRVDVGVEAESDGAVLTVCDYGPGIPASERGRVFDRICRVQGPDADVAGSGLGLAIVKRITERHDADIALGPGFAGPQGEGLGVNGAVSAGVGVKKPRPGGRGLVTLRPALRRVDPDDRRVRARQSSQLFADH
jgi:signal transduction histidine kinase